MDIGVQYGTCANCTGIDKCTKSCALHLGKALVDYINRVDMIETKIGEYGSRVKGTKPDLITSGHQIFEINSPTWVLTDISTTLDISDKFLNAYGRNAFQLASMYCKHIGMSDTDTKEITDKIKAINRNKLLVLPFKPHTECNVDVEVNGATEKKKDCKILYIKWITDKETHKLNCTIGFELNNSVGPSLVKINIKDYINKFRLSKLDMSVKGNKKDKEIIKITDYGIIKPIVINDGKSSVAIDGSYIYYIVNGETHIIGYWDSQDKLVITSDIKSKAMTKIKDNLEFIKGHKKYIAPYMLYEPNVILL